MEGDRGNVTVNACCDCAEDELIEECDNYDDFKMPHDLTQELFRVIYDNGLIIHMHDTYGKQIFTSKTIFPNIWRFHGL